MKKKLLLFTAIAGMATFVLTSGNNGAGFQKGYNSTGSETGLGNINGCSASGCHGASATAGITVGVELDSAGTPVTSYVPGMTYSVKITGTNTLSSTLPKFGFQMSCIKGSTAVVTPVNAGTFQTTGLPSGVRFTAPTVNFVCSLMEHSTPLLATTGGGATGSTYVESFNWTAPATGTGTVSFWGVVNACNGTGTESGDFWNTHKLVVSEAIPVTGVSGVANEISIIAYPNPVANTLYLQAQNAGAYRISAFDLNGRNVMSQLVINGNSASINTDSWAAGLYNIVVEKDGNRKVIPVVKQ